MTYMLNLKFEQMNKHFEGAFVNGVKKTGRRDVADILFGIYRDEIEKMYNFCPLGKTPTRLSYQWNKNHRPFCLELTDIHEAFYQAFFTYDPSGASPKAKLPFLAYFRGKMGYYGLDSLDKEKEEKELFVTFSDLEKDSGSEDKRRAEEIADSRVDYSRVFNSELEEKKLNALRDVINDIDEKAKKNLKSANSKKARDAMRGHNYIDKYKEVVNEPGGDKHTMEKVGERLGGVKRTNAYNYEKSLRTFATREDEENFYDALGLTE